MEQQKAKEVIASLVDALRTLVDEARKEDRTHYVSVSVAKGLVERHEIKVDQSVLAAAPELLVTLERLLRDIRIVESQEGEGLTEIDFQTADEVIAKARGIKL